MARYKLLVHTTPKPGREAEYHRWYDDIHVPELCEIPGFVSGQRYRLKPTPPADADGVTFVDTGLDHLVIYEIETDDFDATLRDIDARLKTVTMTDAIESRVASQFFEPI